MRSPRFSPRLLGQAVHASRDALSTRYVRLRHRLGTRLLDNPRARRRLARHPVPLTDAQREVLAELRQSGIAFIQADALGVDPVAWSELASLVTDFAGSARVREAIEAFPARAAAGSLPADGYIVKMEPPSPVFPPRHPLLALGLGSAILPVVNAYLGLWAKLAYTDVWHSIAVDIGQRIGSQRWHRDPEDAHLLKVYAYFSPVGPGEGPMEYLRESAGGARYGHLWPWQPKGNRYPSDEEATAAIPAADTVRCTGEAGTIIFCDTDGLHRGGIARTGPRILATWTFVSPAAMGRTAHRRFAVDGTPPIAARDEAARFALT